MEAASRMVRAGAIWILIRFARRQNGPPMMFAAAEAPTT